MINGVVSLFAIAAIGIMGSSIIASYSVWKHKNTPPEPQNSSALRLPIMWVYTYFSLFVYPAIYWFNNKSKTQNVATSSPDESSIVEERDKKPTKNPFTEKIGAGGDSDDTDEDIIEEGYISYYSYDNGEYYKGKSGHIGLTGTTVKLATKYDSYEIGVEDIVEVNNHQSTRIKTYTERGSLDFEKDFEKETGLEIVSKSGDIFLYSVRQRGESPSIPKSVSNYIKEQYDFPDSEDTPWEYTLIKPFGNNGTLKIEGWTDGDSMVQANINADAETKGKSRGVEVGPFTRSKTRSKSSIEGEISGEISDNTYSSEIICFRIYKERLLIDSDIKLDLHYSELDNIYPQEDGVIIEVGSNTFRIDGVSVPDQIGEAVAFIKEQIDTFAEEETTPDDEEGSVDSTDKLRELKELHEDSILTDEEFQSKKEELLDDF